MASHDTNTNNNANPEAHSLNIIPTKFGTLRALSHTPALPVPAPAPDAVLSNGVFHT